MVEENEISSEDSTPGKSGGFLVSGELDHIDHKWLKYFQVFLAGKSMVICAIYLLLKEPSEQMRIYIVALQVAIFALALIRKGR